MKKVIFLLLTATVLWSYQDATFTIKGTVVDPVFEGRNIYLQEITDNGFQTLQTLETAVVQNGTFTFTGMADENALRYVSLDENVSYHFFILNAQDRVPILLERGTINITFGDEISVSGTRINTAFSEFSIEQERGWDRQMDVALRYNEMRVAGTLTDELAEEMRSENVRTSEEMRNLTIQFIKNNIENEIGKYYLRNSINRFNFEEQEKVLALADSNFRAEPHIARVITRIENYRNVAVGKRFVDFTMNTPEGNEVSLSDFAGQGNYTLIFFGATWCPISMQQVPQLVELYAQYKNKGFEIVGISFERNHSAWIAGIERYNITWPQMSDMLTFQSPVWDLYAIRGVPTFVLLDREGIIIARNLRGEALDNKLAELMP